MPGRRGSSLFLFAALVAAFGCKVPDLGPAPPLEVPRGAPPMQAHALRAPLWPPSQMTHRVILSVDEEQFAMDGHLSLSGTGAMRLVALGAMGQVLFDVVFEPHGATRLLRAAPAFPREWIEAFVCRDVRLIFQDLLMRMVKVGIIDRRQVVWREEASDGSVVRYLIDKNRWSGFERVRNGRYVQKVTILEERTLEGCDRPVPVRLRVEAMGYELHIRIIDLKTGEPPRRLFQESSP